ncbi:MAG: rhomboid family intramembrane serine protease [Bdellovibrionales bacterium]|nr:rhomboid family intramembrane serine protease [Bdellovibrionales bacterium]
MYSQRRHRKPLVIPIIILINILVFLMWIFNPFSPDFMERHFLVSWQAIEAGRYWVFVTAAFSHNLFFHLFLNMFVLNSFGSFMEMFIGRRRIFLFYMIAGIMGNVAHAFTSNFFLNKPELAALGASGAVAGVILLFSLLFPKEKILIFGIIPVPALFGALAFVGLDLYGLYTQTLGGGLPIGHGAHLGGAFTGIIYYFVLRSRAKKKYYI